jgi:hypothetical protein
MLEFGMIKGERIGARIVALTKSGPESIWPPANCTVEGVFSLFFFCLYKFVKALIHGAFCH